MHYSRGNAPAHIPVHEVIESLLGEKNGHRIRPLQDLTDIERKRANLVKLGKRTERIQGDPFGVWPSWAGNVGHPDDLRMVSLNSYETSILGADMSSLMSSSPSVTNSLVIK